MSVFYPRVGLRVLHKSGHKGTIDTVHFGRDNAGGAFAKGGEGYVIFDNFEGGVFCSFRDDLVEVLTDGGVVQPSLSELIHSRQLADA